MKYACIVVALAVLGCSPARQAEIHVPDTISELAAVALRNIESRNRPAYPASDDLNGWKKLWQEREDSFKVDNDAVVALFQPSITPSTLGGVAVLDIRPQNWRDSRKVLVYVHGGGFTLLSAASSLMDTVPLADETGLRVISIEYTRAPFAKFMQITGEVVAVVRALQAEGYEPARIAIVGDSAGGALAAGSVLRMRDEGLSLPGAVVLWSPWADITNTGDTYHTLREQEPTYIYEKHLKSRADAYADPKDQKHPYVSPVYGDFSKGFPPTLIQGGTKEIFLSNFVRLYQALETAEQVVKLDLYEGMWHVFQDWYHLPESDLARKKTSKFLDEHLGPK